MIFFKKKRRPTTFGKVIHFDKPLSNKKKTIKDRSNVIKRYSRYKLKQLKIPFFILLIIFIVSVFFWTPYFKVQYIETSRNNLIVDPTEVEIFLGHQFINKNIFLIKFNKIYPELKKQFPQWKAINLKRKFPNTIIIDIKNYTVLASLKVNISKKNADNQITNISTTYAINELGNTTIADIDMKSELKIIYFDTLEEEPKAGDNLVPKDEIEKIQQINDALLNQYELASRQIYYYKKGREARFDVYQFLLWFDLTKDIKSQFYKFDRALEKLDKKNIDYIDLRIKNRIFYKPKDIQKL